MSPRIAMIAVSAFLLGSSAWASTTNCSNQTDSNDGCNTTNSQFVNVFNAVGDTLSYDFNTSASQG
jgi:hypothetical protein